MPPVGPMDRSQLLTLLRTILFDSNRVMESPVREFYEFRCGKEILPRLFSSPRNRFVFAQLSRLRLFSFRSVNSVLLAVGYQ